MTNQFTYQFLTKVTISPKLKSIWPIRVNWHTHIPVWLIKLYTSVSYQSENFVLLEINLTNQLILQPSQLTHPYTCIKPIWPINYIFQFLTKVTILVILPFVKSVWPISWFYNCHAYILLYPKPWEPYQCSGLSKSQTRHQNPSSFLELKKQTKLLKSFAFLSNPGKTFVWPMTQTRFVRKSADFTAGSVNPHRTAFPCMGWNKWSVCHLVSKLYQKSKMLS